MNPHPAASPAIGQMVAHKQMVIMEQMLMLPASPQMPKTEIKDPGQEHTVNPDPSVPEVTAPPAEQALPSNEPAPGSSNGNGAIYDPVFGWVVPGDVQQSTGDSDGDLNKQVGNMG